MLDKLKILLDKRDESGEDDLLKLLLEQAEQAVLSYTRRENMTDELESVALRLAVIYYNRMGTEGQSGHTEGNVSRTFDMDIPSELCRQLKRYIKVRVI